MIYTKKEKALSAISYIGWLFVVIVVIYNRKMQSKLIIHHLRQSLILNIIASISVILQNTKNLENVGTVIALAGTVFLVWGVVYAIKGKTDNIPVLSILNR